MREPQAPAADAPVSGDGRRKGPLSFLSGALTSGLLCVLCVRLSKALVLYFALHPPTAPSRLGQSIATALKTLLVGTSFLATFSFGFIALGLSLVFVKSLLPGPPPAIADRSAADSEQSP